jgi:hypothetical protein
MAPELLETQCQKNQDTLLVSSSNANDSGMRATKICYQKGGYNDTIKVWAEDALSIFNSSIMIRRSYDRRHGKEGRGGRVQIEYSRIIKIVLNLVYDL